MTAAGVRVVVSVLPTWGWVARYIGGVLAALLIVTVARVTGPLLGMLGGLALAGPLGALVGLLVGGAGQDSRVVALVTGALLDGADRLHTQVSRSAANATDRAARPMAGVSAA